MPKKKTMITILNLSMTFNIGGKLMLLREIEDDNGTLLGIDFHIILSYHWLIFVIYVLL